MFNQLITTIRNQIPWTDEPESIEDGGGDEDDLISSIKSEVQAELDLNACMRTNSLSDDVYFSESFSRGDIFTLSLDPIEDMKPTYGATYVMMRIDNHMSYRKGTVDMVVQAVHFSPIGGGDNKRVGAFINLDEMTLCQYDSGHTIKKISAIEVIGKMYECGIPDRMTFN
jgi:hypothetical protein